VSTEVTNIDYLSAAEKFWLGEQLSVSRFSRAMDIPCIARLLGLSQAQVLAIESGIQGPFRHIGHFVQGVREYARLMNTPQSIEVLNWLEWMEEAGCSDVLVSAQPLSAGRFNRYSNMGVSIALIVLGFIITLPLVLGFIDEDPRVTDRRHAMHQSAALVQTDRDLLQERFIGQGDNHQ